MYSAALNKLFNEGVLQERYSLEELAAKKKNIVMKWVDWRGIENRVIIDAKTYGLYITIFQNDRIYFSDKLFINRGDIYVGFSNYRDPAFSITSSSWGTSTKYSLSGDRKRSTSTTPYVVAFNGQLVNLFQSNNDIHYSYRSYSDGEDKSKFTSSMDEIVKFVIEGEKRNPRIEYTAELLDLEQLREDLLDLMDQDNTRFVNKVTDFCSLADLMHMLASSRRD